MIIGFAGYKGSGKDLAGSVLVNRFGFQKAAFADPIKDMISEQFGIDRFILDGSTCQSRSMRENPKMGAYGLTQRELMQKIGTFYTHNIAETFWSDKLEKKYLSTFGEDFVVTDVRFPCEVEMIERNGGRVIKITREGYNGEDHISERALENWKFDTVVNNHGSEDNFKRIIEDLMKVIV